MSYAAQFIFISFCYLLDIWFQIPFLSLLIGGMAIIIVSGLDEIVGKILSEAKKKEKTND